ncbi:MAG: transcriptional regulator [Cyclobacteriaceae bacterium]|jgi:HTH-type transcriptional regulator/antitoxin HigA|nr:transcriptional regulator [Cyclobacteriaceae bacterium]
MKTKKIKPIRSEADYNKALGRVDELWGSKKRTDSGDELEIWVTLIEAYEAKKYPIGPPDPIDAIEFFMEQKNLKRVDLAKIVGSKGLVSDVLNRKKPLTIKMIKSLHANLGVPYEALLA